MTTTKCLVLFFYLLLVILIVRCVSKVPTFKLAVTLSNLNRSSNFLHCWKSHEISDKTHTTLLTSP